jgi:lysozyme family protein
MSDFEQAYKNTKRNEGGFTWDPHPTAFGIDRKFWEGWGGWPIVDAAIAKVGRNEKKITGELRKNPAFLAMVEKFYRRNFWLPIYGQITSQSVANFIFDRGVNIGTEQLHRYLQCVLGIVADGKFGKITLFHVNQRDPIPFVAELDKYVDLHHYQRLAEENPEKYGRFENTWKNRT